MDCDPTFACWLLNMVFVFGHNALSELSVIFSFQVFLFTIFSGEFGICAPFLIKFSSVGKENSDGGKTRATDYISVCVLLIFISW